MIQADPRDPRLWTDVDHDLALAAKLRGTVLAAGYDDDAATLLSQDAGSAGLASLNPGNAGLVATLLHEASACGVAATVCACRRAGSVELRCSDGTVRSFRAGGRAGMTAPRWLLASALGSCTNDEAALGILCYPPNVLACQEPREIADDFWPGSCVAMAAFYRGENAAIDLLRHALDELTPKHLRIADPDFVRQTRAPVLLLALRFMERQNEPADQALEAALQAHCEYYGAGPGKGERLGLLAFEIAGVCAALRRRGTTTPGLHAVQTNPLTAALLAARPEAGARCELLYRFPRMSLVHDGEAHWFLDLQGFPRSGRSHEIVDNKGVLEARYRASGAPGLPPAEACFVLENDSGAPVTEPPALTYAELVHLYGTIRQAIVRDLESAHRENLPALIGEGKDLLDAIEARFPRGAERFVPDATGDRSSREMFIAAPETFTRAWVARQRAWLMDLEKPSNKSSRPEALAFINILKAQVMPILQSLSHDRSGVTFRAVRPRPEDYAKAFLGKAAEIAREYYAPIWGTDESQNFQMRYADAAQTVILCDIAPAGMLGEDNELSRRFPGGYRAIAHLLDPHRVWIRWKCVRPGEPVGMAYDGLVWLDDHWAWFPKPYRALGAISGGGSGRRS